MVHMMVYCLDDNSDEEKEEGSEKNSSLNRTKSINDEFGLGNSIKLNQITSISNLLYRVTLGQVFLLFSKACSLPLIQSKYWTILKNIFGQQIFQ